MITTKKKKKSQSVFPRKRALKLARLASNLNYTKLKVELQSLIDDSPNCNRGTWAYYAKKTLAWLNDLDSTPPFTIFVKGNSKLPFFAFSALPIVTCPGMGECGKWCYSLKAWRTPGGYFRQLQNTILVKSKSKILNEAWVKLPKNVDVRLYVDGDIDSMDTLYYWFNLMNWRKDLQVYGYSKSWGLFLTYDKRGGKFPSNYALNLSSGSKFENNSELINQMKALPISRGTYTAIKTGKKNPSNREVREAAIKQGLKNIFVCPGLCGSCVKSKGKNIHACGSNTTFKNINIVIGIH